MNTSKFNEIIKEQIAMCLDVLLIKADEYATEDRLHNFNVGAELTGKTPKEVLGGFMLKHTVSLYDMINDGCAHKQDKWDEKITDHINYLLILKAIISEEESAKVHDTKGIEPIKIHPTRV